MRGQGMPLTTSLGGRSKVNTAEVQPRLLGSPAQKRAVTQMDAVEKAQGNDTFFHGKIRPYAPKKFLREVRVPSLAWDRQRNCRS